MQEDSISQENPGLDTSKVVKPETENELTDGELDEVAGGSLFQNMLQDARDMQERQNENKKLQAAAALFKSLAASE